MGQAYWHGVPNYRYERKGLVSFDVERLMMPDLAIDLDWADLKLDQSAIIDTNGHAIVKNGRPNIGYVSNWCYKHVGLEYQDWSIGWMNGQLRVFFRHEKDYMHYLLLTE